MIQGVGIYFFVNGKRYGYRRWHAVPRKGDEVMLLVDGIKQPFKVLRVVWGVESANDDEGQQANVEVRRVK